MVRAQAAFAVTVGGAETMGRGVRLSGRPWASRAPMFGAQGAAAASQPLATQTAVDLLKTGGSAVDAAIGANAVLGVVEPTGAGIGGDLFALVWDPEARAVQAYNGSGRSPRGLDFATAKSRAGADGFLPKFGAVSVSTPGAVDGWFALHQRYGRLPMSEVLAPAIGIARDGFVVTPLIASYWRAYMTGVPRLAAAGLIEDLSGALATYTREGLTPEAGRPWRNPDLAATYEAIAAGGRAAYYEGSIAERIAASIKAVGGWLSAADLAEHAGEWVQPVSTDYRGCRVFTPPPNGTGLAVLQMLNLLEGFDLRGAGPGADAVHLMIEAKKLAYADRARFYADPSAATVPIEALASKAYADWRRGLIDPSRAAETVEPGAPLDTPNTVYLTTADRDGMMVSLIQSNYFVMGSGLVPPGLGFMLQNRGAGFSLDPAHPNAYAPGKRPFNTIAPCLVTRDGAPWMSLGVMGGAMQPQGIAQVLVNRIDFGLNVQEAGDAARWQHQGSGTSDDPLGEPGGTLALEHGFDPAISAELTARGHRFGAGPGAAGYGGYQAIEVNDGVYQAATEMRFDGAAAAY